MALIPVVGRKSVKMRLLTAFIYGVLTLGAITTLYPFLVMIGSSFTSDYDQDKYAIVPAYLTSDRALFGKFVCDKYGQDLSLVNAVYGSNYAKLDQIQPPVGGGVGDEQVDAWQTFFSLLPDDYKTAGFTAAKGQYSPSLLIDHYRDWLRIKFHDDIRSLDRAYTEEDTNFLTVYPPYERPLQRLYVPGRAAKEADWADFKRTLHADWFYPVLLDPLYRAFLRDERYSGNIDNLNRAWGTRYASWTDIHLDARRPIGSSRADWTAFAQTRCPLRFIAIADSQAAAWSSFQASRHIHRQPLPIGSDLPSGPALRAYSDFIRSIPAESITIASTENLWQQQTVNGAPISALIAESDWRNVRANTAILRQSFLARNYKFALDYLLIHGRGILNTVIYCSGAVLVALIVNPLCAYALSRFNLPYTQALLLFLLATMAFPAEVAMIPNFLLLKQLGLLNTFWALILPAAASGFSIFLLKGFFDSLPQELYEAGMIDGASEVTLFARVTLPLSKPIFAVIALQAFTAAYGAFLFAMIVCQAQSHWTLMVWIYQFQALSAPQYVMMAALVIAAVPTLLVFMFTQKIIMRGIILPSMK